MPDVVFSVSQVCEYLGKKLMTDPFLGRITVAGEVTNFNISSIGHAFFSLKDESSMIDCIMYDFAQNETKEAVLDGAMIKAGGRITFYRKSGSVQLAVERAQTLGIGDLYARFEQTKKKLAAEGLFSEAYKKPLPRFPAHIGVVTSAAGAAVQDIINVATRRFDGIRITVYPAQVQGEDAARQICAGVRYLNERSDVDVIIVGRGGGSFEDLFAFNEERVARAVFASDTPVVSAVGHETDYSLCDMASDLRAPTPSAAAELVVPEKQVIAAYVQDYKSRLMEMLKVIVTEAQSRVGLISDRIQSYPFDIMLAQNGQRIKSCAHSMDISIRRLLDKYGMLIDKHQSSLQNLDPRGVLERGYAIVYNEEGGVVASATQAGEHLEIEFADGRINVERKD